MSNVREALITDDIDAYLDQHRHKSLLRFITCGSVDDGKSTLIGRLLYESQLIFDDQLAALQRDSQKIGTQDGEIDFALLVDGLAAEREQGITIDVVYRFFTTEHRKFIVADTPGHEQYTRNMVTGASTADAAVILIDARRGVLTQTRRHTFLVSLLGIDRIVLAVNKLDLVDYDRARFDEIVDDYKTFAAGLGLDDVSAIPLSALRGDNIVSPSARTPWYDGPTLLKTLETLPVEERASLSPFRMSVQRVNRPDLDFRGFSGMIAGGTVRPGDDVSVLPSGRTSRIERISTFDGDLGLASAGQSVTLVLQDEIDVSRGDLICSTDDPVSTVDEVEAMVVWMHDEELVPDRRYAIKLGSRTANGSISRPHYKVDVNTLEHHGADSLELNEIGRCTVTMDRPVTIDSYVENRDTGGFLIIDRTTNATVGCGMVTSGTRRRDVEWQDLDITARRRADLKGHGPGIIWFTGLSGAGKSTIANRTERLLHSLGMHTYLLDGDNVRQGLNRDLSFTEDDRVENVRRVAEVANLMADAGLVVLVSFISPFRAEREFARDIAGAGRFCEVYVDTPLEVAERRDPKGLYRRARAGEIDDFTGIDSPYEAPNAPDVHIDTTSTTPEQGASQVIQELRRLGVLPS